MYYVCMYVYTIFFFLLLFSMMNPILYVYKYKYHHILNDFLKYLYKSSHFIIIFFFFNFIFYDSLLKKKINKIIY